MTIGIKVDTDKNSKKKKKVTVIETYRKITSHEYRVKYW